MDEKRLKWYERSRVIATLVILVFPLGCFLMFRYQHTWYTKFKAKLFAIGLACFLAEAGIAACFIMREQTAMVWIDDTAAHYHSRKNCSNIDHPYRVSLKEAKAMGKKPCKDCYH